ncbi:MAG: hypothetical protein O3B27_06875 [Actinomycetota bacterium]|nr:hypothetical protein [Actinomycetota bacterium]
MIARFIAPLATTGAALAAAIAFAPIAAADNGLACKGSNLASVCQKNGHSSIVATPGDTRAGNWPFGPGGLPALAILG